MLLHRRRAVLKSLVSKKYCRGGDPGDVLISADHRYPDLESDILPSKPLIRPIDRRRGSAGQQHSPSHAPTKFLKGWELTAYTVHTLQVFEPRHSP